MNPYCVLGVITLCVYASVTVAVTPSEDLGISDNSTGGFPTLLDRHRKIPVGQRNRQRGNINHTVIAMYQKKSVGPSCTGICNYCANHKNGSLSMGNKCKIYCVTSGGANQNFYFRCLYIRQNSRIQREIPRKGEKMKWMIKYMIEHYIVCSPYLNQQICILILSIIDVKRYFKKENHCPFSLICEATIS